MTFAVSHEWMDPDKVTVLVGVVVLALLAVGGIAAAIGRRGGRR